MNANPEGTPIEVLLVEDDPGDVLMTREALAHYKVNNRLNVVSDGEEAIAYLRRQGRFGDAVRPDLVLLDLNLPRRDGREVLAEMAEGRSNASIAESLVLTKRAVEKHVGAIFQKLCLEDDGVVSRRVTAVLLYLAEADART